MINTPLLHEESASKQVRPEIFLNAEGRVVAPGWFRVEPNYVWAATGIW